MSRIAVKSNPKWREAPKNFLILGTKKGYPLAPMDSYTNSASLHNTGLPNNYGVQHSFTFEMT